MAVEGSTGKKTLRSLFCHIRGRIKKKKKKRLSLTCDLASGIMPTRYVHLRESDPGELFLSPHTSFLPLLLSFKSCCSGGLESLQSQLERWGGLHRVCSQSALDEATPPSGSQQRRRASSKLPGLSGLHPSLPPPSPADR